ncbi:MAG: GNAT family N-acetyltransferase, partial [Patescibacteria group bacterium]|nr:GNAT family N-acetyltransferase [Patescibacteria group bacterium]
IELASSDGEVTLRQYSLEDSSELFALIDRNRTHLSQNYEDTALKYPSLETVQESILHPKNPSRRRFAIRNKQGLIVGGINITTDDGDPKQAEIGYWQGAEFTGNGYISRAVEVLTTFGFQRLGYELIYGKVFKSNTPSLNVLKRAGYEEKRRVNGGYIILEIASS